MFCWHKYEVLKVFSQKLVNSSCKYVSDENHISVFKCNKCSRIKAVFHTKFKRIPGFIADDYIEWMDNYKKQEGVKMIKGKEDLIKLIANMDIRLGDMVFKAKEVEYDGMSDRLYVEIAEVKDEVL